MTPEEIRAELEGIAARHPDEAEGISALLAAFWETERMGIILERELHKAIKLIEKGLAGTRDTDTGHENRDIVPDTAETRDMNTVRTLSRTGYFDEQENIR